MCHGTLDFPYYIVFKFSRLPVQPISIECPDDVLPVVILSVHSEYREVGIGCIDRKQAQGILGEANWIRQFSSKFTNASAEVVCRGKHRQARAIQACQTVTVIILGMK